MYESTDLRIFGDPHPDMIATVADRARYNAARDKASAVFRAAQSAFEQHHAYTRRGDDTPLTALERLALAAVCCVLADDFDAAAEAWDAYRPNLPVAVGYRNTARDLRTDADLNETLAEIAPSTPGAVFGA